jgi:hypothetical protein
MAQPPTAVIVSSFDSYQDLWEPFFTLFFRYWPDCPFPVYLIANRQRYPDRRVTTLLLGEDRNWATNMRAALAMIPQPYLIYMQEDYLLERPVDTGRILRLADYMQQRRAACLRLYPSPGPDRPCADNLEVGEIDRLAPYRVCLQAALWDRQALESLLVDGESAWNMEGRGSIRSRSLAQPFLSVRRDPRTGRISDPALPYFCTGVIRGRWVRGAVALCAREGIAIDRARRAVETPSQELWRLMRPTVARFAMPALWLRRRLRDGLAPRH